MSKHIDTETRDRRVEACLVFLEVDDQLCGTGRHDPLERMRARVVLVDPNGLDERIEGRCRNTMAELHDGARLE